MSRFRRASNLAVVGLPALGIGCVAPQQEVNQRDSTGITIVENRSGDHALGWRFELAATIGGANHDVELNELTEYTVDADTLGHIFVIDSWFGTRVQLVDTTGKLLARLTRQGGGPGEIGNGVSVSATADGIVAIMDHSKAGLVRIRWDGQVQPTLLLTGYGLFGGARAAADTVVLHTMDTENDEWPEQIQYRTDTDTATLVIHSPARRGWIPFCGDGMAGLTEMLTPDLRWTARGSQTVVHRSADYRIDDYRQARLTRSIRRTVTPVPGNAEAVRRFFPEGKVIGSRDCIVAPAELARKRGVAPVVQPIRRLAIDLDGRIWAERNTFPDEPTRTDVFDRNGRYEGTLSGFGAPLGFPSRSLTLFALPDSVSNLPRLGIYRRVH
jgi:hypothetical protein